jgi:hypothetical protein
LCSSSKEIKFEEYRKMIFEALAEENFIEELIINQKNTKQAFNILLGFSMSEQVGCVFYEYLSKENRMERFILDNPIKKLHLYILQNFSNISILEEKLRSHSRLSDLLNNIKNKSNDCESLSSFAILTNISIQVSRETELDISTINNMIELLEKFDDLLSPGGDTVERWQLFDALKPMSKLLKVYSYRNFLITNSFIDFLDGSIRVAWTSRDGRSLQYCLDCCILCYSGYLRICDYENLDYLHTFYLYFQYIITLLSVKLVPRLGRRTKIRLLPTELIRKIIVASFPSKVYLELSNQ